MNFKSLNESFEDKYIISKNLLVEEEKLLEEKKNSKKRLVESIDRPLNERDWKLTVPGNYRDAIFNAGEEEDFDGVRSALIDICNYVIENIDEADFDLDDQNYIVEEFEEFAEELDQVDFDGEDEANYYLNELYDLLDNTDIFLGLREAITEDVEEEEDPEETYRLAIIDWLYDHDQARKDIEARTGVGIEHLSLKGLKAVISDYKQLAADFETYFNDSLDESLNESQNQYDEKIFDIWWECVDAGPHQDYVINDIIENFIEETGKTYFDDDLDLTISNLTNSEKRALLKKMQEAAKDLLGKSEELLSEEKVTGGNMEQEDINLIEPLINFLDELEDNYKNCSFTWNFGRRNSDNKMTAGVDVYLSGDFDNEDSEDHWLKEDEEILDRIKDNLPEYGFKFDDSLGYDSNPWKEHAFGNGYHTQIIEDIERPLDEEIHPNLAMVQDRYTAAAEKGLEEQAREILSDNLIAVKEGQCIETSVNSNTKAAYFALRRLLKESLSESAEPVKPSKEQFEAYVTIQRSGVTNMFDVNTVRNLAIDILGVYLDKPQCLYIYKHYDELMDEYKDEINIDRSKVDDFMDDYLDESLNEEFAFRSNDELYDLDKEISDYLNQNDFHGMIDLAYINPDDVPVPSITYEIHMGDWKHEHLFFKQLIQKFMDEKNIPYTMTEEDEDNGSDTYTAYHTIHLMKHKEDESLTEGSGSLTAFMKKSKDFHNAMNNFISTYSTEAGIPTHEVLDMIREYLRSGDFDYPDKDEIDEVDECLTEDTVKQDSKWVNKGKEGTHGKFKTKKEADAQRKAMFANGYKG